MKQSLSKLVDVILQKLADQPESASNVHGLRSWLLRQGYAKGDIETALSMVGPRQESSAPLVTGPGKIRHLSDFERYRLTPEAHAALNRLELYELIDPFEREMILERLDQFDGPAGVPDLEYLVNWIVCPTRNVQTQQTIYHVLDGPADRMH